MEGILGGGDEEDGAKRKMTFVIGIIVAVIFSIGTMPITYVADKAGNKAVPYPITKTVKVA
jgi:hypothetical protein